MYMYYILRINLRIMNYSKTVKKIVEFIFKNIYIYKMFFLIYFNDGYMSKYVFKIKE